MSAFGISRCSSNRQELSVYPSIMTRFGERQRVALLDELTCEKELFSKG